MNTHSPVHRIVSALGTLLLATASIEATGLTWSARPGIAGVEAALGALLLAVTGTRLTVSRAERWCEAAAWGVAALLLPDPWRPAAAITALACSIDPAGRRTPAVFGRLAEGVRHAGQMLAGATLAVGVLLPLLLRDRGADWLSPPLAWLLGRLGVRATAWSEGVGLETLHGAADLPAGWATFAAPLAIALTAAALTRILQQPPPRPSRAAGHVVAATLAATVVGTVLSVLVLSQVEVFMPIETVEKPVALLYSPSWRALLAACVWLPWVARSFGPGPGTRGTPVPFPRGLAIGFAALAALTGFAVSFEEPGARKPGRVMIDEGHSEWETVTPAYDTDWYGADSGYNYAAISAFLSHHFALSVNRDPLTPERLAGVDVLILKTPTRAYAPAERDAVVRFVREGGGLFLVGEHTNVWGSGVYLDAVARPFGFTFEYDVVFDLRRRFEQLYVPPALARHPVTAGVDAFLFAVSCSIRPDALAVRPVMWQGGLWSLDIDYAVSNFYPQAWLGWRSRVGPHVQCVARHAGRGRVAGFTDSTVWSNFSAMLSGKPELLLGIVEWLNRSNRLPDFYPWGLGLAWLVAAMAMFVCWTRRAPAGLMLALVLTGAIAGARLAGLANAAGHVPPRPSADHVVIEFLENRDDYELGSWGFVTNAERSYSIFFQWMLRPGFFPRLRGPKQPPLEGTRLAVAIVDSSRAEDREAWVRERLDRDLPVLLLLRPGAAPDPLRWLLDYGVTVRADTLTRHEQILVADGSARWPLRWLSSHRLAGGSAILTGTGGAPLLVRGKAPLYVMTGGECFADGWMGGDQADVPDSALRRHFELEFSLVRGLVHDRLATELAAGAGRPVAIRSGGGRERQAVDRPGRRDADAEAESGSR